MFRRSRQITGLVVIGLTLSHPGAHAAPEDVKHPCLLVTRAMIPEIKQKIETEPWAAELWKQVKAHADRSLGAHPGRFEVGLAYALTGDKVYAEKLRAIVLTITRQRADKISWQWGPRPVHLAVLYDLGHDLFTPEEHTRIQTYFRTQAKTEITARLTKGPTPNMSAHAHMSVGLIGFCLGDQELIDWALDDKHSGGFRVVLQGVSQPGGRMSDGGLFWREATWNYASGALGYWMTLAEAAYNNGVDLFAWKAEDGHTIKDFIDGYFRIAFPVEATGVNRGTVRVATFGNGGNHGPMGDGFLANPPYDGTPPHTGSRAFPSMAALLEVAYRHYRDPAYAWMISLNPKRNDYWYPLGFAALTHGVKMPKKIEPPDARSGTYAEMGLAMLRNVEGPDYWHSQGPTVFHKAAQDFPHGHRDYYQIVMHAFGRLIYPDLITASGSYEQHPYLFARRSCGHNTIVIDQNDQRGGEYTISGDFAPELKFAVSEGKTKAANGDMVSISRALFLTGEYLADLFSVDSEQPHTYDWYLHGLGRLRLSCDENFKDCDLLRGAWPVKLIHDEKQRSPAADVNWWAEWIQHYAGVRRGEGKFSAAWFDRPVGVRMSMLGEAGTTVLKGKGPYTAPMPQGIDPLVEEGALPLVAARRTCKATTFVAVHEPFQPLKGRPRIKAITRLLGDASATGVMIDGGSFRDFAAIALKSPDPSLTLWSKTDKGERIEFNDHAYIRNSGNKIVARGGISRFTLYAPKLAAKGVVELNGKTVTYRMKGGYAYYGKDSEESPDTARIRLQEFAVSDTEAVRGQGLKISAQFLLPRPIKVGIEGEGDWETGAAVIKKLGPGRKHISCSVRVPDNAEPGATAGFYFYFVDEAGKKQRLAGEEVAVVPDVEIRKVRGCRLAEGTSGHISLKVRSRMPGKHKIGIHLVGLPDDIRLDKKAATTLEFAEEEEREFSLKIGAVKKSLAGTPGKLHRLAAALVYKDVLGKQRKLSAVSFPITVGLTVIEETVQTQERLGPSRIMQKHTGYRAISPRYEARFTEEGRLTSLVGPRDFELLPQTGKLLGKRTVGEWTLYADRLERPLLKKQQDHVLVTKADRAVWADGMERTFTTSPNVSRGEHTVGWVYLQDDKHNHGVGACWLPINRICSKAVYLENGWARVLVQTHNVKSPDTLVIVPGPREHAIPLMDSLLMGTASKVHIWMVNFKGTNFLRNGGFETRIDSGEPAGWELRHKARLNEESESAAAGKSCIILAHNGSKIKLKGVPVTSGKKTVFRFRYRNAAKSQLGVILTDSRDAKRGGIMKWGDFVVDFKGSDDRGMSIREQILEWGHRPDQRGLWLNNQAPISNWITVGAAFTIESGQNIGISFQNRCNRETVDQRIWIDEVFIGQEP